MPVVVVSTLIAKPDSVDTVRAACKRAIRSAVVRGAVTVTRSHITEGADPHACCRRRHLDRQARLRGHGARGMQASHRSGTPGTGLRALRAARNRRHAR